MLVHMVCIGYKHAVTYSHNVLVNAAQLFVY